MYVKIDCGVVTEIIPDVDSMFPDVPIEDRFPAEFIAALRHFEDGAAVEVGMEYDEETGSFGYPEPINFPDFSQESPAEETAEISQAEINLDFEYRLSCLELGID